MAKSDFDDNEEYTQAEVLHAECFNPLMAYTHGMTAAELLHAVEKQAQVAARYGGDPKLEATAREQAAAMGKFAVTSLVQFAECIAKHSKT